MAIHSTCTWGEGPDILVEIDDRAKIEQGFVSYVTLPAPQQQRVLHGSFCLTVDEAKELVLSLLRSIDQVQTITHELDLYAEEHWK